MSITALSLQQDATSQTCVGGSPMALSSDGVEVKNGIHVGDMSTGFLTRTNITLRTRNPVKLSDGTYTKAKRFITIVVPDDLGVDEGGIVFNLIRIEVEMHPKSAVAKQTNLQMLGSQALSDTDLDDFLFNGSLK